MGQGLRKAGLVGVTFNDLRGTAVALTRLALAGCTEAEIATCSNLFCSEKRKSVAG